MNYFRIQRGGLPFRAENDWPDRGVQRAGFADDGGVIDSICRMRIRIGLGDYRDGNEIRYATEEIR